MADARVALRTCWLVGRSLDVRLIQFSRNHRVLEHKAGVGSTLVGLKSHDQDRRAAGESLRRWILAAHGLRQWRVLVSVEQLQSVSSAVL